VSYEENFVGICDECGLETTIVLVCMIGCQLCAICQEKQQRISHRELTDFVLSDTLSLGP